MKRLPRRQNRFKGLTIGLDLHKKFIQFCVMDRKGTEIDEGRINSDREHLERFISKWKVSDDLQVSMEACGTFIWVFDTFVEKVGRDRVHVAQPSRVRVIAQSMEKNDSTDAWWLAYLLYEGRLPEAFVAEGAVRELRLATRELRAYTEQRADLLRRFKSHVSQEGLILPKNWFASQIGLKKARKVMDQVPGQRLLALKALLRQIRRLTFEMKFWRVQISKLSEALPEVKVLADAMPGIGTLLASVVTAELGNAKRFTSAKAYAKATGLTPGFRESGGRAAPVGITRAGSRHVRWALTRAIIGCLRCKQGSGAQIRGWVQHVGRYKPKRKVIVAAARKVAEGIWRLFNWGECFDLKKAFPIPAVAS